MNAMLRKLRQIFGEIFLDPMPLKEFSNYDDYWKQRGRQEPKHRFVGGVPLTRSRPTASRPAGASRSLLTQCRLTAPRPTGTSLRSCPIGLQTFSRFVQTTYNPSVALPGEPHKGGVPLTRSRLTASRPAGMSRSLLSNRPTSLLSLCRGNRENGMQMLRPTSSQRLSKH